MSADKYPSIFSRQMEAIVYLSTSTSVNNKQLLDEVEHDIMNYQNRGLRQITQTRGFDNLHSLI